MYYSPWTFTFANHQSSFSLYLSPWLVVNWTDSEISTACWVRRKDKAALRTFPNLLFSLRIAGHRQHTMPYHTPLASTHAIFFSTPDILPTSAVSRKKKKFKCIVLAWLWTNLSYLFFFVHFFVVALFLLQNSIRWRKAVTFMLK